MLPHSYRRINGVKAKLIQRARNLNPALANDLTELKLPWYYIRNIAESEEGATSEDIAEIFIYDEIGGSFGVDANEFIQDLQGIKAKEIIVRINSPGGNVLDAIAIYNSLVQHSATVTTRVDSIAASAASIIAMAGDKVEMMVGSQLMIHDAMVAGEVGNARDLRETAKWLDMQSDNIASMYAAKGGDAQDWRALMLAETWMFANEAVEMGLADSVYTRAIKQALEEEMPEEIEPDEETEALNPMDEDDEKDEDSEKQETEDLEALMAIHHRLTNRGYKYSGREKAPSPLTNKPHKTKPVVFIEPSDTELDNFIAGLSAVLERN